LMQIEALESLNNLRLIGEKRGLVISATGTGKTYLSAFDVRNVKPERVLFLAHREQILMKSLNDYRDLIGGDPADYGIYSGSKKDIHAKYMFATVQTFSKESHLEQFSKDAFDYIIIDEAHKQCKFIYE